MVLGIRPITPGTILITLTENFTPFHKCFSANNEPEGKSNEQLVKVLKGQSKFANDRNDSHDDVEAVRKITKRVMRL